MLCLLACKQVLEKKRSLVPGHRAQTQEKILLNNVTAQAKHGQLLAVAGPSGSSKTTFLDALAGRIRWESLEGLMLVNGTPMDHSFRKVSQYVMQDDALFPTLTTRETLLFSAKLRLPASVPVPEKLRRVEAVMRQLKLSQCSNTFVGNEEVLQLWEADMYLIAPKEINSCFSWTTVCMYNRYMACLEERGGASPLAWSSSTTQQ